MVRGKRIFGLRYRKYVDEAYIYEFKERKKVEIRTLRVKDKFRGSGVGSKVIKDVCRYADKKGFSVVLEASPIMGGDTRDLITFYERFGFKLVDIETGKMVRYPK